MTRDVHISAGRDLSGQQAVGSHISQTHIDTPAVAPTREELDELRRQFGAARELVAEEAPAEQQEEAAAKLDELEEAVLADEPQLSTMEHVRDWFARNLPSLLTTVTGLVVNPVVGKLVGVAGDALAGEFRRRFGLD